MVKDTMFPLEKKWFKSTTQCLKDHLTSRSQNNKLKVKKGKSTITRERGELERLIREARVQTSPGFQKV